MLGRGIDQILPFPSRPNLFEAHATSAVGYLRLAEALHGPIPRQVAPPYVWGDALAVMTAQQPAARIVNLETAVTTSNRYWPKGINYRMHPDNVGCLHRGTSTAACWRTTTCSTGDVTVCWRPWPRCGAPASPRRAPGATPPQAAAPAVLAVRGGSARAGVRLRRDHQRRAARLGGRSRNARREPAAGSVGRNRGGPRRSRAAAASAGRSADRLASTGAATGATRFPPHSRPSPMRWWRAASIWCTATRRIIRRGSKSIGRSWCCTAAATSSTTTKASPATRISATIWRVMYLPRLDGATGRLLSLRMVPMQIRRFRLNRPSRPDAEWLYQVLARESARLGTAIALRQDGSFAIEMEALQHASDQLGLRFRRLGAGTLHLRRCRCVAAARLVRSTGSNCAASPWCALIRMPRAEPGTTGRSMTFRPGYGSLHEHWSPTRATPPQAINDFHRRAYGGPCPPPGVGGRHLPQTGINLLFVRLVSQNHYRICCATWGSIRGNLT